LRDSKTPLEVNFENDDIKTLMKGSSTIHIMKVKNYKIKVESLIRNDLNIIIEALDQISLL
jgi:hypothetical protein